MEHLYPQPTARGIARTRALYLTKFGKEITEEEARRILAIVMRFLWLSAHPLPPALLPPSPSDPSERSAETPPIPQ